MFASCDFENVVLTGLLSLATALATALAIAMQLPTPLPTAIAQTR
jgi:hypothetical protein